MEKATDWRTFIPAIIALLFTLLAPYLFASSLRNVAPLLGVGVIFFYMRRTDIGQLSLWVVVLCGLLVDILQAMPLGIGVSAALLLMVLSKQREERQQTQRFSHTMFRFMAVSAITMTWIYLLMSLVESQFFPLQAPLVQWVLLVLSYPLIYALCHAIHQQVNQPSKHF